MGRRKKAVIARLKSLGNYAQKGKSLDYMEYSDNPELQESIQASVLDDIVAGDSGSSVYSFPSRNGSGSSVSSLHMDLDDIDVQNETQLLTFIAKMKENMSQYLKSLKTRIRPTQHNNVRGRLQISARNLSVRNYPSRQAPSGSDSARDSPSAHSSTPVAGKWEVWLETVVVWWRVYAHVVIAHE
ncbi:hypothetical protein M422DRAFT_273600 [Sphaerobolus stellatus SS14]|uniref:Uncharacterized protein n=1 Tax=Sphaerobolus stellatus (strain SS14) TaxID=990650 RepID=A0A0C9UJR4_SPHS4|nr:hypothetical protein M422DRAFT_273600 [Sphaerobolus stellatus SS14]